MWCCEKWRGGGGGKQRRRGDGDEERKKGCVGGKFGSRPLTLFGVGTPVPPVIDLSVRLQDFFPQCSASAASTPANSHHCKHFRYSTLSVFL